MAEDLGPPSEELLHSRPGYRLSTGVFPSGEVYYAREYDLPENVDLKLVSSRLAALSALAPTRLSRVLEASLRGRVMRIVQAESQGASLSTLLQWEPQRVTVDGVRRWSLEYCLFLRSLLHDTDWVPGPVDLSQFMIRPDGRMMMLAPGWDGLFQEPSQDREAAMLERFREFTALLLAHLEQHGQEATSLHWMLQHRFPCLNSLRESLEQGAVFRPGAPGKLETISSFEVPEVRPTRGILSTFFAQPVWRLALQFLLAVAAVVLLYLWQQPEPLPTTGVYALMGERLVLLDTRTKREMGVLKLPHPTSTVGLLPAPPRLLASTRGGRGVSIIDRTSGRPIESFAAEGPVDRMVGAGSLLCMNQGGQPGVLVYDGTSSKVAHIFLTRPGVETMVSNNSNLVAACNEYGRLYSFALPNGGLTAQRELSDVKVLGSAGNDVLVSYQAGQKLARLDSASLKTRLEISPSPKVDTARVVAAPDNSQLWALSTEGACRRLNPDLSALDEVSLPGPAADLVVVIGHDDWEMWFAIPSRRSVAILDGKSAQLKAELKVPGKPTTLLVAISP